MVLVVVNFKKNYFHFLNIFNPKCQIKRPLNLYTTSRLLADILASLQWWVQSSTDILQCWLEAKCHKYWKHPCFVIKGRRGKSRTITLSIEINAFLFKWTTAKMPLPIWPFQWETSNQLETEKTACAALMKPVLLIKGWFQQINISLSNSDSLINN